MLAIHSGCRKKPLGCGWGRREPPKPARNSWPMLDSPINMLIILNYAPLKEHSSSWTCHYWSTTQLHKTQKWPEGMRGAITLRTGSRTFDGKVQEKLRGFRVVVCPKKRAKWWHVNQQRHFGVRTHSPFTSQRNKMANPSTINVRARFYWLLAAAKQTSCLFRARRILLPFYVRSWPLEMWLTIVD